MNNNLESKIFIYLDSTDREPLFLGSMSTENFMDELQKKLWSKAHKKSKKDNITLLKALKILIKRLGFEPEVVKGSQLEYY